MAEYATAADICNKALQEIGCALIGSLTDDSRNANECNFLYDKTRVALLREHVWNFAISYATLTAAGTLTYQNGSTRNKFTLPAGYMRLADQQPRTAQLMTQATSGGVRGTDYSIEGGFLVTAQAGVLLRYAADISTVTLMDPLFCDALAARMCVDGLAETLTGSVQKRQLAGQRYADRIALAKLLNAIEAADDEPLAELMRTARTLEQPPAPAPQGRGR